METMTWTYRGTPKAEERFPYVGEWPAGPWDDEPDKVQWPDPDTGFACLAVRNRYGAWCGYVGLPAGHPWRELGYEDIPADVHGGLTYGPAPCMEDEEAVCHVVDDPAEDDVMWVGFDCHHAFDASPGMSAEDKRLGIGMAEHQRRFADVLPPTTYKPLAYVRAEVTRLAAQAHAAA